jgi:hypothetical protein
VVHVAPDGAAALAGLQPRDLIVNADGRSIATAADLTTYVASHRAGDRVTLTVMRGNGGTLQRLQVVATLGPPSASGGTGATVSTPTKEAPPPASRTVAPAAGMATDVAWRPFADPYERAFSIEVPQAWKVVGGTVRKNPLWPNAVIRALSPDRRTMIAFGDPDAHPYGTPIAARDEVRRFSTKALSHACLGMQITRIEELPDVERYASAHSLDRYAQWSAAQATFLCSGDRQDGMRGEAIAVLKFTPVLHTGQAQTLAAFVTRKGQEAEADRLLNHMVSSFRVSDQWAAQEQRAAGQIAQGAMDRWRAEQRQSHEIDDAITNTAHFVAPSGRHYDLDARPLYQWQTPNGDTVGTNTPTPPTPGATMLKREPP